MGVGGGNHATQQHKRFESVFSLLDNLWWRVFYPCTLVPLHCPFSGSIYSFGAALQRNSLEDQTGRFSLGTKL